ncbi:4-hydroxythreonine-4-phosphate dehydrogenase PdxA [Pseudorhodoplanes sinuspersici]|uniref:4-hydroxythreonine-4-phosphate dehydrogenase n=1 Tax=Pseudorhodoplanes sinuspersici TaxID=1235591 RepID=A0A1W6ZZF1_9HYPH|nr:4-hydroxythreonine-4-phosphate dehydrogenase PdxA [Pseudorhodoplanes sinuspersici]ARQ02135.1 4-hydroxythreonine-4-phosphate dehydrogenase PdxA [Pseudorhodoplanes sinuspersici]RKE73940.1 4-hydroxythreonine-4-phosphate dehydrogenase [Pseudorhodoplanes sinuspersici]
MLAQPQRPLALTIGEPAGIGSDITLAAWQQRTETNLSAFYVIADPDHLAARATQLGLTIPIQIVTPEQASTAFHTALPVVPIEERATAQPGHPDDSSADVAIASIRRAVRDVIDRRASAIVTNPISKVVLYRRGFTDPGHTEYLARLAHEMLGVDAMPVMMLWCKTLAVIPVTIHVPLSTVPQLLNTELIVKTGRIVVRELTERFGIRTPRLAVTGLNPHAGENGTIGDEEATIIRPAIEQLGALGIAVRGPLPADTLFHPAARRSYDAALCMYHDQALIPIKTIAFDDAVNVTLGLPFVRTSPDHGTAFDIAGKGGANPASLIASLRLAARMAERERAPAPAP